ncbi:MAG TPA: hypothetical protein VF627_04540 [Abditibacterium sp.]
MLQNELARIDREWELEREKYVVRGRYGSSIPTRGQGTMSSIVITIFGGIWTAIALFMAIGASSFPRSMGGGPPALFVWFFPVFGVFFIVMGLRGGADMNQKAEAYLVAERDYQNRRAQVLAKMQALESR